MVTTFITDEDFDASAQNLDRLRCGKQRTEAWQIWLVHQDAFEVARRLAREPTVREKVNRFPSNPDPVTQFLQRLKWVRELYDFYKGLDFRLGRQFGSKTSLERNNRTEGEGVPSEARGEEASTERNNQTEGEGVPSVARGEEVKIPKSWTKKCSADGSGHQHLLEEGIEPRCCHQNVCASANVRSTEDPEIFEIQRKVKGKLTWVRYHESQLYFAANGERLIELGYLTHTASLMWIGYEDSLASYINSHIKEWKARGYVNNMKPVPHVKNPEKPFWLGEEIVENHRGILYTKDPIHYSQWESSATEEYLWPDRTPEPDLRWLAM